MKRQDCPWNFKASPFCKIKIRIFASLSTHHISLSTLNLHSHCLASPPKLHCRTPNLQCYRPLSHWKFSKILYPSYYFLTPTIESFSPLSTPNVARRFLFIYFFLSFTVYFLYFSQLICMPFLFPTRNYKGLSFLWWWIWHQNFTLQGSIFYNQISEHVMLQDLNDDGVRFADLLWGEIWVFLFREERGVWWGLVLWVSGLLAIIVYHCVYFVDFITI